MAIDRLWRFKTRFNVRGNLRRVLPAIDVVTALPTLMGGAYFYLLKRVGLREMPLNKKALDRVGIWPVRRHYYEPFFNEALLRRPLNEERDLPGIDLRVALALDLVKRLGAYGSEPILGVVKDNLVYRPDNGTYGLPDAAVLYAFVRHMKPARIFEVGSGNSTLIVIKALERNRAEGHDCRHLCVEPFEMPWLERSGAEIRREMIEDVDLSLFDKLKENDILFVDSSHMIRPQGDVLTVMQNIISRLAPGVVIHIHDLFTPRDYPYNWLVRDRTMWNEQYLVEAFLAFNQDFETLLPSNHLYLDYRNRFDEMRPELASGNWQEPTSFWLRRKPIRTDGLEGKTEESPS